MIGVQNPLFLGLLILLVPAVLVAFSNREKYSLLISGSRVLIIGLLVLAAASPFITVKEDIMEEPEITVLKDRSTSSSLMTQNSVSFEEIEVKEKTIASGNSSDLKNGILRNIEPDTAYLAISDFRSTTSLEQVTERLKQINSSLSVYKTDMEAESAVSVKGPSSTVPGATNRYTVKVSSTQEALEPSLKLDGEEIPLERTGNSTWSFTRKSEEPGTHTLEAVIDTEDRFASNNRYYATVEVREKPEIAVLGEEGGLEETLGEFFELEYFSNLPGDLSEHYAVLLKQDPDRELIQYTSEGNGVVYTGDYEKEVEVLPVRESENAQDSKGAKIVLAIDISKSTQETGSVKRSKKIAYNLVEELPFNNRVGAIAYNGDAYRVTDPKPLSGNRNRLMRKISRLNTGGPSAHDKGLTGARKMLNGTGNIIMITDGRAFDTVINGRTIENKADDNALKIADELEVKLITVGVGENKDENFLRELAQRGGGFYLDAVDANSLKFNFKAGGAAGETVPLTLLNSDHFITEGLELSSAATNFDQVETRASAKPLISGTDGSLFLSSWRYGLGRVAAFSGGDKELSQLSLTDPKVITRSVSWAVGNPQRKREKWIESSNSRHPEPVELRASYNIDDFSRESDDLYTKEVRPDRLGFHTIEDEVYSYNYDPELEEVGYNEDMKAIVRETGGEVYTPDELEELKNDLKSFAERKTTTKKDLSTYLILLAMIVFLGEVGFRKLNGKK